MASDVVRVVSYRFRTTFSRRWGGYVSLVVLIGLIGGVAMGSVAAARRTQSSYPAFLAATNASDLTMSTYAVINGGSANNYSPQLTAKVARLPGVNDVESWVGAGIVPLLKDGLPNFTQSVNPIGSVNGLYFDEDRVTPVEGQMANPNRADEFVTTAIGAQALGLRVGQSIPMGMYSSAEFGNPLFGTSKVQPVRRLEMRLVGIVVFNNQVIEDDTDKLPTSMIFTPALTRLMIAATAVQGTWYAMQLSGGVASIPTTEKALIRLLPSGSDPNFTVTALTETKVERAVKPESIALGVFGAIAALAALAIASLAIARQLRAEDGELQVLRALGASPSAGVADGLTGLLAAIVFGAVLAAIVAVALSPLSPLGPIHQVYHPPGIDFDWTVLGLGLVVFIGGLGVVAGVLAYRGAAHRRATNPRAVPSRSKLVHLASAAGMPISGTVGVRFALSPGQGRTAVPTRSVIVGAVLAIVMVTATLTFSSGLHTLISRPSLYGWNWNYALTSANDIPPAALTNLDHDPDVASFSGYHPLSVQLDNLTVPVLLGENHAAVTAPILSGHAVDGNNQIVLGSTTLSLLHERVGDTVRFSFGSPNTAPLYLAPETLVIVGTATLPAIGGFEDFADHPSMGTGAIMSEYVNPAIGAATRNQDPNLNGPGLVFVRLRDNVAPAAGLANLSHVATLADEVFAKDPNTLGDSVNVLQVQRPAEIVNYQSTGATPIVLATGLAVGAVLALALTLVASVKRRRRDLAMLKSLGFTTRQVGAAISWQASVIALIAAIIGVPVGIAVGRELWDLFARDINAVPQPTVPASVFFVAVGAIILANLVAAIPARIAAHTPAALVLRSE